MSKKENTKSNKKSKAKSKAKVINIKASKEDLVFKMFENVEYTDKEHYLMLAAEAVIDSTYGHHRGFKMAVGIVINDDDVRLCAVPKIIKYLSIHTKIQAEIYQ